MIEYNLTIQGWKFSNESVIVIRVRRDKMNKQQRIAQDLSQKIRHGIYECGSFLPSENQLTDLYNVSRETIRGALAQLEELGLIQKIRGKGSLVLDIDRFAFPISGITSFSELNQQLGMEAKTELLTYEKNRAIIPYFVQHGVSPQCQSTYIERLRLIDGQPVVLDCDYLLNPPIEDLPKEVAQKSLYHYIEDELGLEISYATKEMTVEQVDDHLANTLQLDDSHLAVVVRSLSYLKDTTLFQLTESYHRPDKFKFNDFARRNKIDL